MSLTPAVHRHSAVCARTAEKILLPMQPGDVEATSAADVSALEAAVGFKPDTPIQEGIDKFVAWYRAYDGV